MRLGLIGQIGLMMMVCGCATIRDSRPYSQEEKFWFAQAIIGQSLDCVTTAMALEGGADEMNPVWWDPRDTGALVASKTAILGGAYVYGMMFPNQRKTLFKVLAVGGYGAAGWNGIQIAK